MILILKHNFFLSSRVHNTTVVISLLYFILKETRRYVKRKNILGCWGSNPCKFDCITTVSSSSVMIFKQFLIKKLVSEFKDVTTVFRKTMAISALLYAHFVVLNLNNILNKLLLMDFKSITFIYHNDSKLQLLWYGDRYLTFTTVARLWWYTLYIHLSSCGIPFPTIVVCLICISEIIIISNFNHILKKYYILIY